MKVLTIVLGIAVLAFGATSMLLWNRLQDQRAAIRVLESQLKSSGASRSVGDVAPSEIASKNVLDRVSPSGEEESPKPHPADPGSLSEWEKDRAEYLERLKNPEYRASHVRRLRQRYSEWPYATLARELRLSDEQAGRLRDLLVEQEFQLAPYNIAIAYRADRPPPEDKVRELLDTRQKLERAHRQERLALLGESKLRELDRFFQSVPVRWEVREFQEALRGSADPLRDDQIPHLVSALTDVRAERTARIEASQSVASRQYAPGPAGLLAQAEEAAESRAWINERRLEAVTPYLSPSQLAKYRSRLEDELAGSKVYVRALRRQLEKGEPPVTTTEE